MRYVADTDRPVLSATIDQAGHHLLEIANIAGIAALQQVAADAIIELWRLVRPIHFPDEMFGEGKHIFQSFAQGRQPGHETRDPEIEVGAKGTALHHLGEIAIGGADQPKIRPMPNAAADALVAVFLDDPQQLRLQRERQFSDLVQEQRTSIRQRERAQTLCQRTREGAAFVSKKLATR